MKPPLTGSKRRQARPDVEWVVLDETPDWAQPATAAPSGPHHLAKLARWSLACAVFALACATLWLRAEAGLAQMTGEVKVAVQGETLQAHAAAPRQRLDVAVTQVEFQPGVAMAEVVFTDTVVPGRTAVYREARFYTQSPHGWQRSAPAPAFWGELATLDTASLHFVYHRLDGEAVAQVAARSETLYRSLHALLGLPTPTATVPLTVEVLPAVLTSNTGPAAAALRLTSPHLIFAREDQSWADVLYETLKQAMVRHVLEEAQASAPARPQWDLMVTALHSWLLATADAAPGNPPRSRGVALLADSMPKVRPRLAAFLTCVACSTAYPGGSGTSYQLVTQTNLGPWLIDLLVAHYGPEVLPRLLEGFNTYEDWETLAPAVFGKSAAELEAEWQSL